MPGTFSPPPWVSDPDMHHGTCVTHVSWCMPGSMISCFLWSRWRGKRSRQSRRMRNPQFYVSGKRPIWLNPKHMSKIIHYQTAKFRNLMYNDLGAFCMHTQNTPWLYENVKLPGVIQTLLLRHLRVIIVTKSQYPVAQTMLILFRLDCNW